MTDVKVMSVTFLLNVLEIVIDSVMDPTFHMTISHNGDMLLLPHACRIVQHRDRTRRGNSHFCSTLCSALDLVSFPSGRTSVLGLELGTRLRFVD